MGTNTPGSPQEVRNSTRKPLKILSNSPTTCFLKKHLAYEQWLSVGEYVVWVSSSGEKQQLFGLSPVNTILIKKKSCWYQPGNRGTCQAVYPSTADAQWCISPGPSRDCPAYWALQWLSRFCRGNYLLCSQCHQKTLSPENYPAMAERVVQQLVQLPPL